MPPSGFSEKATAGLLVFMRESYRELVAEVESGKHLTTDAAIESEIDRIGKWVRSVHLDPDGVMTEQIP